MNQIRTFYSRLSLILGLCAGAAIYFTPVHVFAGSLKGQQPIACDTLLSAAEVPRFFLSRWLRSAVRLSDLNRKFRLSHVTSAVVPILDRYPADQYFVVGIGRSPFALIELMNLINPGSATTVPISYNEYTGRKPWFSIYTPWKRDLEPFSRGGAAARQKLFDLMDQFLPTEEQLGGRQIVILDFADYGSSLAKFSTDLKAYLESRQRPSTHQLVFLSVKHHSDDWYLNQLAEKTLPRAMSDAILGARGAGRVGWWMIHEQPDVEARLRTVVPKFLNLNLKGDLNALGHVLDAEAFKPFAPYAHYVPDPGSRHFAARLIPRPKHALFARVMRRQFEDTYARDEQFRAVIDRVRR